MGVDDYAVLLKRVGVAAIYREQASLLHKGLVL